jgi:hypothetical protein
LGFEEFWVGYWGFFREKKGGGGESIPSWRRRWSARRIGDERELEMFFHQNNTIENDFTIL